MSYFSLRKHAPEPVPDDIEEEPEETAEEPEDGEEEQPGRQYGPLLTGLSGPGHWLAARFSPGAALAVHGVAVWAIFFYGGWIAAGIILVWLFTVGLFVPREDLDRLSARFENRDTHTPEEAPEGVLLAPGEGLALWLLDTIGERPGIHVRELYPRMRELPGQEGRQDADLKALLKAFGVPVQRSLRLGRIAGRTGVRRADVEALLPSRGERHGDSALYAGQSGYSPSGEWGGEGA